MFSFFLSLIFAGAGGYLHYCFISMIISRHINYTVSGRKRVAASSSSSSSFLLSFSLSLSLSLSHTQSPTRTYVHTQAQHAHTLSKVNGGQARVNSEAIWCITWVILASVASPPFDWTLMRARHSRNKLVFLLNLSSSRQVLELLLWPSFWAPFEARLG